jgi:hypothetical protein
VEKSNRVNYPPKFDVDCFMKVINVKMNSTMAKELHDHLDEFADSEISPAVAALRDILRDSADEIENGNNLRFENNKSEIAVSA